MPGRVSARRQFTLLARSKIRGQSGPIRVSYAPDPELESGIGVAFAIGRKVGNAVVRNRLRRQLRSHVDQLSPTPRAGIYLIRCNFEAKNLSYEELGNHLARALSHLHRD